jgi:hypothetical protein
VFNLFAFFHRLQHNSMSSIRFDSELCSTGKMQWWQCHRIVRSMLVGKRNVGLIDDCRQPTRFELTGTISPSIGLLTALTNLCVSLLLCWFLSHDAVRVGRNLFVNQLSGTLTSYIGQLTALTGLCVVELWVDLSANLTVPCPNRRSLSENQFSGTIPTQIGRLQRLRTL